MLPSRRRSSSMMARSRSPRSQPKAPRSSPWPASPSGSASFFSGAATSRDVNCESTLLSLMDGFPQGLVASVHPMKFDFRRAGDFFVTPLQVDDGPDAIAVKQLGRGDPLVRLLHCFPQTFLAAP